MRGEEHNGFSTLGNPLTALESFRGPKEGGGWVDCALLSNKTINADPGKLNNVSFTTAGDENGIYRLGDMFEVVHPRG